MNQESSRSSRVQRETKETSIQVSVQLDGTGTADINTGIGFFDHMLDHVARHGLLDLTVHANGDLHIDAHHTVEDVGICLGKAVLEALGDSVGLTRYGHASVPMDEALAEAAIDLSGRPFLAFSGSLPSGSVGGFDAELAEEFFRAFSVNSRTTLHLELRRGENLHHCLEVLFKAFARALAAALVLNPRVTGVPSTKGMLEK